MPRDSQPTRKVPGGEYGSSGFSYIRIGQELRRKLRIIAAINDSSVQKVAEDLLKQATELAMANAYKIGFK